ncbi:MAG: glycosyltransferase family 4 protein [Prevotella sp.]|jgi:glycosyltransferase involved in cell wall biosynthesis
MKKIILFTDCLGAGGAQRQLVGLAIMLKEKDYNVTVATYHNIDFYKKQLDDAGVRNLVIPNGSNKKTRIWAVRTFLKKERPDWVVSYQETPSLLACIAKVTGCKFRLIVSERNTTQAVGMNERVRFFLYRWADAIVPNSYAQENYLTSHYPWMQKKLKTITNFVDLDYFSFIERKKRKVPEIVIAATIWSSKNTLGFIEAVKKLVDRNSRFHVSWYGKSNIDMDYYNESLQKIQEYGIQDYIELKDKTKQIKNVYHNADLFCLPSFYEGTPNVICEAISTGLPVACSDVCDNYIYVKPGCNGVLFDPNNPNDMANKISQLLYISSLEFEKYQKNSRQIALGKLSKDVFVDAYVKIIES